MCGRCACGGVAGHWPASYRPLVPPLQPRPAGESSLLERVLHPTLPFPSPRPSRGWPLSSIRCAAIWLHIVAGIPLLAGVHAEYVSPLTLLPIPRRRTMRLLRLLQALGGRVHWCGRGEAGIHVAVVVAPACACGAGGVGGGDGNNGGVGPAAGWPGGTGARGLVLGGGGGESGVGGLCTWLQPALQP